MSDVLQRGSTGAALDTRTRLLLDAMSGPVISTDAEGRIVYWNPAAEELFGWTQAEVLGRPRSQILTSEPTRSAIQVTGGLRRGETREGRYEICRHDGGTVTALVSEKPVLDEAGKLVMVLGLARDLTPEQRVERRLVRTELWSKSAFENAVLGIAFADLEGRFTSVNPAMCAIYERDASELIGHQGVEFTYPDDREPTATPVHELGSGTRDRFSTEKRILTPSGRIVWVQVDLVNVPSSDGDPEYLFGQVRDVTEQHETHAALSLSSARWEAMAESVVDSVRATVEVRDPYTAGHQSRVAAIAVGIGRGLGLDDESCRGLGIAATLHDIGKMAVPMDILSKPDRLLPAEYELIKRHSAVGAAIIASVDFPWPVATIIHQHHERLDGSGYPDGLSGADLLPESRILAVADVVEASAAHRPYRPARGTDAALEIIREESRRGTLDNTAVDACVELFSSGALVM